MNAQIIDTDETYESDPAYGVFLQILEKSHGDLSPETKLKLFKIYVNANTFKDFYTQVEAQDLDFDLNVTGELFEPLKAGGVKKLFTQSQLNQKEADNTRASGLLYSNPLAMRFLNILESVPQLQSLSPTDKLNVFGAYFGSENFQEFVTKLNSRNKTQNIFQKLLFYPNGLKKYNRNLEPTRREPKKITGNGPVDLSRQIAENHGNDYGELVVGVEYFKINPDNSVEPLGKLIEKTKEKTLDSLQLPSGLVLQGPVKLQTTTLKFTNGTLAAYYSDPDYSPYIFDILSPCGNYRYPIASQEQVNEFANSQANSSTNVIPNDNSDMKSKYLKYKSKYLQLKNAKNF